MKKWTLILGLFLLAFAGCTKDENDNYWIEKGRDPQAHLDIKKIAWDYIGEGEYGRSSVIHRWELAGVSKGIHPYFSVGDNPTYVESECYRVIFNTELDDLLGPIRIMVDLAEEKVIGFQPRY